MHSEIHEALMKKTNNGKGIPYILKNGVKIPKVTIFEDIILRNLDNMDTVALEINDTKLTYADFILEVEKYMRSFKNMGFKEKDVVSLCLPVCIEFICAYYALTTLGITCNALNIMFLLSEGVANYLDKRCSGTLICDENYLELLISSNAIKDTKLKTIIIFGNATYTHFPDGKNKIEVPNIKGLGIAMHTFDDFLSYSNSQTDLLAVEYNEERISTLNYTSGTTGTAKCMGHSDLAPLFLVASHDNIKRDEYPGDRTLLTIPLQHPTGLFYAMVFQMAQGKTLVLESRYDKKLFSEDIKRLNINHAVQAKPFYAQLIQDRADGKLKPGDFENFKNPYSGGEGIPYSVCQAINDTLQYAGCPQKIALGYGRSEEGSSTLVAYHIIGRENTVGIPLPGIQAKLVDTDTLADVPFKEGARGEILISSPVMPIHHCYLDFNNSKGMPDGSIVDSSGIRWARPRDIAEVVKCADGTLSYSVLGRAMDYAKKADKTYYLFDLKEKISNIVGIQECEVLSIKGKTETNDLITVHVVLSTNGEENKSKVLKEIYNTISIVDGVKFYDYFGINATSGKCDRKAMQEDLNGYYRFINDQIELFDFGEK